MDLDAPTWEPDEPVEIPVGVVSPPAQPAPASAAARPTAQPQGSPKMYEPDDIPRSEQMSPQWEPYDSTAHIPPYTDVRPPPGWSPGPPPGRQYATNTSPPLWQPASLGGLDLSTGNILIELVRGVVALGAGAAVGYVFTGEPRAAAAGALAVMGAVQLPSMFGQGGLVRAMVAAASFGGAYFLAKPYSPLLDGGSGYDDVDSSSDEEGPDVFQANEGEQDEEEGDEPDDGPAQSTAKTCSFIAGEPARKSPWLRQVKSTT